MTEAKILILTPDPYNQCTTGTLSPTRTPSGTFTSKNRQSSWPQLVPLTPGNG